MSASGPARLRLVVLIHACLVRGCKKIARRLGVVRTYEQTKSNPRPCKVLAHAAGCVSLDDRIDACRRKRALRDIYLGPAAECLDDNKFPVLHSWIIRVLKERDGDSKFMQRRNVKIEIRNSDGIATSGLGRSLA